MNDMTYLQVDLLKLNINTFIKKLEEITLTLNYVLTQEEKEFYIFISKHIIFFKYLYRGMGEPYYFKVLISDLYYYILSILKHETRYMYVNERSIIENYVRAITRKMVEEDHVTEKLFNIMKNINFLFDFTEDDYALIKSEYSTSCGYIHGGNLLDDNLSFVFCECLQNNLEIKDIKKYHERIRRIFKICDEMLISEYGRNISGCFHREKTVFKYLLGSECMELLFKAIEMKKKL